QQERRACYLEFQAARAERSRRVWWHGRRHVGADRQGRTAHHLAGARKRTEKFHRRRCLRSAKSESRRADRPPQALHSLELAGIVWRYHGGRIPDAEGGTAAGRTGTIRRVGAGETAVNLVFCYLGSDFERGERGVYVE